MISNKRCMMLFVTLVCLLGLSRARPTETVDACLALKTQVEKDIVRELRSQEARSLQEGSITFGFLGDEALLDCEENNCAFNNPKSPYGMTILPLSPEEDLKSKSEASSTPKWALNNLDAEWGPGNSPVWQLRYDEVVVAMGCTPPPETSRYFSFTGYLFDAYNEAAKKWVSTFGSLQDSLSIYREDESLFGVGNRLKTAAAAATTDRTTKFEMEQSSAFNKWTVVVMGASHASVAKVEKSIKKVLNKYELLGALNRIVISEPFAKTVGLDPYDSYYALIVRNIVPEGRLEAFKDYVDRSPLTAWRWTPTKEREKKTKADLFKMPPTLSRLVPSGGAASYEAEYADGVEMIIRKIEERYKTNNVVAHALGSGPSLGLLGVDRGLDCVERFVNICNGDNRDAQYLSTYPFMLLDTDEKFAYMVGVNHHVVGLAVYNNVAVSDPLRKLGIRSIDDEEMIGSAARWLKGTPFEESNSSYYAIRFARNCHSDVYCVEIPLEGPRAVPYDQQVLVHSRLYVNPATGVGPHEEDVVMPHLMTFTPRGQHTREDIRERVSPAEIEASPCMSDFLSLTICAEGISADCCNGVRSWTENGCYCSYLGKLLLQTLPKEFGESGLRVLSMMCGKAGPNQCPADA